MNGASRSAVDGARSRFEPEQRERSRTSDSAVPITYASGEVEMVPDSEIERREPMLASGFVSGEPPTSAPSRYGIAGPRGAVGALPYLALIGFVAVVTIGIFFGAGFSMLVPPSRTAVVDPGAPDPKRPDGDAALADREIAPVSQEPAASGSAVKADIPRLLAQPPSIGSSAGVSPPVPPVTEPFSQTGPASGQPSALAPAMQAGPVPLATASTELSSEKADHADQETRPAVRHGSNRLPAGRQSAHRHHKRAKKPATFDKLITKLTGQANSVDPQLTPPRASLSPPDFGASYAHR
jgi:hypothetical protein